MTHRQKVLKLANIPEGPEEQANRLETLAQSFQRVRERAGHGENVDKLNADYAAIHDLWHNLDLAQGQEQAVRAKEDHGVKTDPLTQLKVAADYGVLDKQVANDLQREFKDAVKAITGKELSPLEIKKLHQLMIDYNPFQPR